MEAWCRASDPTRWRAVQRRRTSVTESDVVPETDAPNPEREGIRSTCSEAWVTDRTGHESSVMLAQYHRATRTVAKPGLGDMLPLDEDPRTGRGAEGTGKRPKIKSTSGGMADAPDLGSGDASRESSSLSSCTKGHKGCQRGSLRRTRARFVCRHVSFETRF